MKHAPWLLAGSCLGGGLPPGLLAPARLEEDARAQVTTLRRRRRRRRRTSPIRPTALLMKAFGDFLAVRGLGQASMIPPWRPPIGVPADPISDLRRDLRGLASPLRLLDWPSNRHGSRVAGLYGRKRFEKRVTTVAVSRRASWLSSPYPQWRFYCFRLLLLPEGGGLF